MSSVLIVEDDQTIRTGLSLLLRMEGHVVVTAANGAEALDHLQKDLKPCLILLDLMMPVMDGKGFRSRQLQDQALAAIPVAILSGVHGLPDAARDLQIEEFLTKPFNPDDVYALIDKYCC